MIIGVIVINEIRINNISLMLLLNLLINLFIKNNSVNAIKMGNVDPPKSAGIIGIDRKF